MTKKEGTRPAQSHRQYYHSGSAPILESVRPRTHYRFAHRSASRRERPLFPSRARRAPFADSQRAVANRPANRGLRLDYVLASSALMDAAATPRVADAFVLGDGDVPPLADHTPVGCTVVL